MSARILVAGRSEICRELFNDPEAYGSHIADREWKKGWSC